MPERELLWRPSRERVTAATLTSYQRWLREERGVDLGAGYEELWSWSVTHLEEFWSSIASYFDVRFSVQPEKVLGNRKMPGAQWFPGATAELCRAHVQGPEPGQVAIEHASELRELDSWTWRRLARETAQIAAGLRARGIRPGDRVVAYMPNIPETAAAFLACARSGRSGPRPRRSSARERGRSVQPDRARSWCWRSTAIAMAAGNSIAAIRCGEIAAALPSAPELIMFGYLDGSGWEPGFLGDPAGPAGVRAAAVRSSPLGPLQLGHDRPAEADRAQPGRDPARAAEVLASPSRRPAGRPRLLVFDDRLDDVEPARRRAAHGRADRAVRRQPWLPEPEPSLGPRRADQDDLLRDQRGVHRGMHEGWDPPPRRQRPECAEVCGLDRLAAVPGGLPLGV